MIIAIIYVKVVIVILIAAVVKEKMLVKMARKCLKVNNQSNQRTPCAHWPEKSNERARGSCLLLKTFDLLMILQGSNWGWYELSHA